MVKDGEKVGIEQLGWMELKSHKYEEKVAS